MVGRNLGTFQQPWSSALLREASRRQMHSLTKNVHNCCCYSCGLRPRSAVPGASDQFSTRAFVCVSKLCSQHSWNTWENFRRGGSHCSFSKSPRNLTAQVWSGEGIPVLALSLGTLYSHRTRVHHGWREKAPLVQCLLCKREDWVKLPCHSPKKLTAWDSSVGKSTGSQAWPPEFHPQNTQGRRRELTALVVLWPPPVHQGLYTHKRMQ